MPAGSRRWQHLLRPIVGVSLRKAQLVAAINDRFADAAHLQAVDLLRSGAQLIGGGAGGARLVAGAGGRKADKLAEALATARQRTTELLDQG